MSETTDHLNAIVREYILTDDFVDNIFYGLPTFDNMWDRREMISGGFLIDWTFFDTKSQMGQTITAFHDYLVKPESFAKRASIEWADYIFPVVMSKREIKKAKTPEAIIKMTDKTVERTRKSARGMLSGDMFGDGQVYNHELFDGVQVTPMKGFKLIIDENRSYAGHDSTDNPLLDSYVKTIAPGNFGEMYTSSDADFLPYAMEEVLDETEYDAGENVDFIVTTKIMRSALKRAGYTDVMKLSETHETSKGDPYTAKMSYKGIEFEGRAVMIDIDCPAGYMFFTNSDTFYLAVLEGAAMNWQDFQDNSDSDAIVGNFEVSCQIICEEPRKQGVIKGGSTSRSLS